MLSILAVFVPSFFMVGVGRQLFVPLALAVGAAMFSSYLLSSTLVPVLATWLMRKGTAVNEEGLLHRVYAGYLDLVLKLRWPVAALYLAGAGLLLWTLFPRLGTELFPTVDAGQFKLRLRAPTGTRIERTELVALKALDVIKQEIGAENIEISSAFIGVQPASYPINTIYLWTSGSHEAVMQVALKPSAKLRGEAMREKLRDSLAKALPDTKFTFEAGDIVSEVMAFGSPTPVEVAVQGPALPVSREFAGKVEAELKKITVLRDLQYAQPFDYPTLDVQIDRERAGQFGLTMSNVARSLVMATSSSRFIEPNYWRDPASGNAFQIQVEIPQNRVQSVDDVANLPVMQNGESRPLLSDVSSPLSRTAAPRRTIPRR